MVQNDFDNQHIEHNLRWFSDTKLPFFQESDLKSELLLY